jgi:hypothetical protein
LGPSEVICETPVHLRTVTIMNKSKALALVQQLRRRWRSQESDTAIARRAERVFFRVALVYFIFCPVFVGVAILSVRPVYYILAGTFLICGALLFWRSRRFSQVLRVLLDGGADAKGVS